MNEIIEKIFGDFSDIAIDYIGDFPEQETKLIEYGEFLTKIGYSRYAKFIDAMYLTGRTFALSRRCDMSIDKVTEKMKDAIFGMDESFMAFASLSNSDFRDYCEKGKSWIEYSVKMGASERYPGRVAYIISKTDYVMEKNVGK